MQAFAYFHEIPKLITKRGRLILLGSLAALLFALSACPYALVKEKNIELPSGIKSIAAPLARNLTIEAGLEDIFTQALIKKLRSDGRAIVLEAGAADADLKCQLLTLEIAPVSYDQQGRISAEQALLTAECRLVIPSSEAVLWKSGPRSALEEYPVGADYLQNEMAKSAAISQACRKLVDVICGALLDRF